MLNKLRSAWASVLMLSLLVVPDIGLAQRTNDPTLIGGLQPKQTVVGTELIRTMNQDGTSNATRIGDVFTDVGMSRGAPSSRGGLGKLSTGLKRVLSRTGRVQWLMAGTSLTAGGGGGLAVGPGGGDSATSPNMKRSAAYPRQIANQLRAAGIPTRSDAVIGSGNQSAYANPVTDATAYYEGQVAVAGTVTIPSLGWPGGRGWLLGDATAKWTFAPLIAADQVEFYVVDMTGGAYTITDAAGAVLGTYVSTGNFAKRKITLNRPASVGPLTINVTAGSLYVLGAVPSLTFAPMVEILNAGAYGSSSAYWNNFTALSPGDWISYISPDFVSFEIGANDANSSVAASTFQTNTTAFLAGCKAFADVMVIKSNKSIGQNGTGYDLSAAYLAALDASAAAVGSVMTLDFNTLSASFSASDWFDSTGPHLAGQGYAKEGVYGAARVLTAF
ncbi:MAG TPA: hypothetical protein VF503_20575 [Sphingobium sp.]|uniref:hypothetical protein n=1 Tax=Sphingobium sp. TaxID=1912891 RepID=UPI002ED13D3B